MNQWHSELMMESEFEVYIDEQKMGWAIWQALE